jgi:hypothetical protein
MFVIAAAMAMAGVLVIAFPRGTPAAGSEQADLTSPFATNDTVMETR